MIACVYSIHFARHLYIGSTNNFARRRSEHLKHLRGGSHHSLVLQRAFSKYGEGRIVFTILEECSIDQLHIREQHYFDSLKPQYNGSQNALCPPRDPNVAAKISATLTGRKRDAITVEKVAAKNRGRIITEEHRLKLSSALIGRKRPASHRAAISAGLTGKPKSEKHRAAMRQARLGRTATEETKRRMSDAHKGLSVTENTRKLISAANKGRVISAELRSRLRDANSNQFKGVRCIDTGEVFETMTEAAKARGRVRQSLTCHLQGRSKTFAKQRWEFVG